jgi:hypothetical protein
VLSLFLSGVSRQPSAVNRQEKRSPQMNADERRSEKWHVLWTTTPAKSQMPTAVSKSVLISVNLRRFPER